MIDYYIPFGEEWCREALKLPKRELVAMLRKALMDCADLKQALGAAQEQQQP